MMDTGLVEHAARDSHTSSYDKPNKAFSLALGTDYPYFAFTLHFFAITLHYFKIIYTPK